MYRPIDSPAIRYMFTSFLRGELLLMNLTTEVTRSPMVAVREGRGVGVVMYGLNYSPLIPIQDGPWTALLRLWPFDIFVEMPFFSTKAVGFINWVNHYKEYVK